MQLFAILPNFSLISVQRQLWKCLAWLAYVAFMSCGTKVACIYNRSAFTTSEGERRQVSLWISYYLNTKWTTASNFQW